MVDVSVSSKSFNALIGRPSRSNKNYDDDDDDDDNNNNNNTIEKGWQIGHI